ncbi:MAG: MXAN_6640 family putative metalloprotease, partial [Myxococcales bacterium]
MERFDSPGGGFRVHFTRAGSHRVPSADADADGVPDFVEQVAETYDEVLAFYAGTLGLRAPLGDGVLGGDARFDVYLIDFNRAADGSFRTDGCLQQNPERCFGYIVQENDFAGYGYPSTRVANRVLASHELFHAVQAAYDTGQKPVFSEGTAVWATERFDPSLNDFEAFIGAYLQNPERSLDVPPVGPVASFAYGAAIFFRFLEERFGAELVPALLKATENGAGGVADPYWVEALDSMLAGVHGSSFADAFTGFAEWNLMTGTFAAGGRYANAAAYPPPKMAFEQAPLFVERGRYFYASTQYFSLEVKGRKAMTAALVPHEGNKT